MVLNKESQAIVSRKSARKSTTESARESARVRETESKSKIERARERERERETCRELGLSKEKAEVSSMCVRACVSVYTAVSKEKEAVSLMRP